MKYQGSSSGPGTNILGRPLHALEAADFPELGQRVLDLLEEGGKVSPRVTGSSESLRLLGQESFDLVLVDADLRYVSARRVIERVRSVSPHGYVAVMVGWWDDRLTEMRGLGDYSINKPFRRSQLSDLFQGLLTFYSTDGNFRRIFKEVTSEEEENDAVA